MKLTTRMTLFSLIAALGASAPAAASVLCVKEKNAKPKGQISVRGKQCKDGEVELDLANFGLGAVRTGLESRIDGLETEIDGQASEIAAQQAVIDSQASTIAAQAADIAEVVELTDLLAVQQNHAEEKGSIDDFGETSFTSMVEIRTGAPTDGFLMVWATLNAEYDFNSAGFANVDLECRIAVDGTASSIVVDQEFAKVEGGTNSGESLALQTVVPVSKGGRIATLECRKTGAGMVFVKQRALTTLFVTLEGEAPSLRPIPLPRPLPLPGGIVRNSAPSAAFDTINE